MALRVDQDVSQHHLLTDEAGTMINLQKILSKSLKALILPFALGIITVGCATDNGESSTPSDNATVALVTPPNPSDVFTF